MGIAKDNGLIEVTELVAPAAYTATQTSAAVDLSKYRRAFVLIHAGDWTDGSFTPKIQTSATSGGSYADDTMLAGSDAWTVIDGETPDDQVYKIDLDLDLADARYGKLVVTAAGTTTGMVYGAVLVGELKKSA